MKKYRYPFTRFTKNFVSPYHLSENTVKDLNFGEIYSELVRAKLP